MEKIFKIDGKLYRKTHTEATWVVKIYDYPEEYLMQYPDDIKKYHRVLFGTQGEAIACLEHYTESKDKIVALEKIVVHFQHIVLSEQKEIEFKSIEERSEFFNSDDINNLDKDDIDLIMRVEESKLKEIYHKIYMEKLDDLIKAVWAIK